MALLKEIELDNGVIVKYHRITTFNKVTNRNNIVEISSYTSEKQRGIEKEYQDLQKKSASGEEITAEEREALNKGTNVYIYTEYLSLPYNESQTIKDIYEYLKTTDKYKDAKDV